MLKHTIQWHLKCTIHSVIQPSSSKTLSSPPEETLYPLSSQPLFLSLPRPWQPVVCFLYIYLFWIFYLSEIIQYVTFCVWLYSLSMMFFRFIHVVLISYSFLWLENIPWYAYTTFWLSIYQLIAVWVVHSAAMNIDVQVFVWKNCFQFFGIYTWEWVLPFWTRWCFVVGGCPMHCKMFSSILGLSAWDARGT